MSSEWNENIAEKISRLDEKVLYADKRLTKIESIVESLLEISRTTISQLKSIKAILFVIAVIVATSLKVEVADVLGALKAFAMGTSDAATP